MAELAFCGSLKKDCITAAAVATAFESRPDMRALAFNSEASLPSLYLKSAEWD